MKLAFLILAHKNPQQLERLTEYLLKNGCSVFVHLDKKNGKEFRSYIQKNEGKKNLFIYSVKKVYWGSFNQIEATFFLLEQAIKRSGAEFFSLLSGQDLPVRPISEFSLHLSQNPEKSFLSFDKLPNEKFADQGGLERVQLYWLTNFDKFKFLNGVNVILHGFQKIMGLRKKWTISLYAGANWFTLNRKSAEYLIRFKNDNTAFYSKFKKHKACR